MSIFRNVRPDGPALSKFAIGARIGNDFPRIKPNRQLNSESVSGQCDGLWKVILTKRSQHARAHSKFIYSLFIKH